jgi:cytochrome c oxidase cbb3-type subunit 3
MMKKFVPGYIRIPVLLALVCFAIEYFIDAGDRPAFIKYPILILVYIVALVLIMGIDFVIEAVDKATYSLLSEEERRKYDDEQSKGITEMPWFIKLKSYFVTRQPAIEEEGSIMMAHDYDGIRELDNVLPPWWVKLFYATIIFGVIYLGKYHLWDGHNQAKEFEIEMEEARLAVEEYKKTAKDLIDANSVTLLTDAGDLSAGKKIFETNCVACHRPDAGGSIGPNLTDEYWILGGGIKNVFKTISKGGRDGKGMVAWQGTLKPSEIQLVASYILSLQGTNPADAKAPEGEVYKEEEAIAPPEIAANTK